MDTPIKSFWERKEGFTGILFAVAGVVGGGWLLFNMLPTIIALLQNIIYASILGGALFLVTMFLLDKNNRALMGAMYQSAMRAITSIFVTIDPIGIVKNYIKTLKRKIETMYEELSNLKGQMTKTLMDIKVAKDAAQQAKGMAVNFRKNGDEQMAGVNALEVKRQEEFAANLQAVYDRMEFLSNFLTKILKNSEAILKNTENDVAIKEKTRAMWKTVSHTIRSAQSIILGNPDEKALFDMGMEQVANDIAQSTGELDNFINRTRTVIQNIDMKDGMMKDEGLALLDSWEKESGSLLISDEEKNVILSQSGVDEVAVPRKRK